MFTLRDIGSILTSLYQLHFKNWQFCVMLRGIYDLQICVMLKGVYDFGNAVKHAKWSYGWQFCVMIKGIYDLPIYVVLKQDLWLCQFCVMLLKGAMADNAV